MPVSARKSQFDKALLGLRSLVLNGAFEANARLSEVSLADRLAISRTPLRQAMDRLVEEGLLERIETGGCRVSSFTMADILDAIEVRGVTQRRFMLELAGTGAAARWPDYARTLAPWKPNPPTAPSP